VVGGQTTLKRLQRMMIGHGVDKLQVSADEENLVVVLDPRPSCVEEQNMLEDAP